MRVLHVSPYFAPAFRYGGPPRSVLGLCQGLVQAGVDVQVFTTSADGPGELPAHVTSKESFDGLPVRYFARSFPKRAFGASGLKEAMDEAVTKVDLVHVNGLWNVPVWLAVRSSIRACVPFIVSPRGMLDSGSLAHHHLRKMLLFRFWEQAYLRRAALLHATSLHEEASIQTFGLGPPVVCVPNGVFPPDRQPARLGSAELGLSPDERVVLFLGRLHPTKRVDLFLKAVAIARQKEPSLRALMVGAADGLDLAEVLSACDARTFALALGEANGDERWRFLATADALVLCSDSESFGTSVVEAMAVGTPVVVTRSCPWEEVETRGCGFWVEQRAERIAEAIVKIVRDREESRQMGRRGRMLVEQRYTWPAIGEQMARCYRRVLEWAN